MSPPNLRYESNIRVALVNDEAPPNTCEVFSYPPDMFMDSGDVGHVRMCVNMKKKAFRPRSYARLQDVSGIALGLACDAKIFALEQFQIEIEIRRIVFEFLQPNGSIATISCTSSYTEYKEADTSGTWTAMIHFTGDGIASKVSILGEGTSPLFIENKDLLKILPDACWDEAAR